ncbi:hypothetical protein SAPIO_CDS6265 [Scedosporium apiospermum]|uniref:CHCH domain-containing protein n=1 Tax=Pseudallescheria apiosperma TaxID=563466 RepID=A0A084G4D0_PSEDA|nr:uncharacterized protein SAPIO_CDS6265 [Scedosporium apiospermum]KEZ42192.1 hypothetical protein SAPIO_CDS6265 [Scedosporium apiospermum]
MNQEMAEKQEKVAAQVDVQTADDDDEPDEWEQRIDKTGCAAENAKMTDCYFERKDWRACAAELAAFQQCWKKNHNDERTSMKDVEK